MELGDYLWLVVVGSFAAFLYGFGTGSNDVANAFGTSVGAKTLTLRQAVVIATIFEFTGAMVLGRVSTSTIAGGIADITAFQREPEFYAYGMVCALTVAAIWQILSSYLEINTSSTHSIIGCIMGFSLVYAGSNGVLWYVPDPTAFPPYKGLVPIVISWFFSPIFCSIASAVLFLVIRFLILRRTYAYKLSFWVFPPMVTATVFICIYFVFTKGAKKSLSMDSSWTDEKSAWVSALIAAGCGIVTAVLMWPLMWYADRKFQSEDNQEMSISVEQAQAQKSVTDTQQKQAAIDVAMAAEDEAASTAGSDAGWKDKFKASMTKSFRKGVEIVMHGTNVDVHAVVEDDPMIAKIHANAEVFGPKTEFVFSYLQVFSACCVIFAHGAGEVGYMAGPLATIWDVVNTGTLTKNVTATAWIVVIGASGLVIGLATYGYNVTRAMGVRLAKLSPTRGFCAELATALVIMICSQYGLPTSSSQVITGGIIGVGLCEGVMGVNWTFFGYQFMSWIATLLICGFGTAGLFAAGAYAPCIQMGDTIEFYENSITTLTTTMASAIDASATRFVNGTISSSVLTNTQIATISKTMGTIVKSAAAETGGKVQTADAQRVMTYLYSVLSTYQNISIDTLGQNTTNIKNPVCNDATADDVMCRTPTLLPKTLYKLP